MDYDPSKEISSEEFHLNTLTSQRIKRIVDLPSVIEKRLVEEQKDVPVDLSNLILKQSLH